MVSKTMLPELQDPTDADGYPTVLAVRTASGLLRFPCRYCGRNHHHGGGDFFGDGDGHRVAHCMVEDSPYKRTGYVLREVSELPEPEKRYKPLYRHGQYVSGYLAALERSK